MEKPHLKNSYKTSSVFIPFDSFVSVYDGWCITFLQVPLFLFSRSNLSFNFPFFGTDPDLRLHRSISLTTTVQVRYSGFPSASAGRIP